MPLKAGEKLDPEIVSIARFIYGPVHSSAPCPGIAPPPLESARYWFPNRPREPPATRAGCKKDSLGGCYELPGSSCDRPKGRGAFLPMLFSSGPFLPLLPLLSHATQNPSFRKSVVS